MRSKSRKTSKSRTTSKSRKTSKSRRSAKERQRVRVPNESVFVTVHDHTRKDDDFAGTSLHVVDQDNGLTSDVIAISPQQLGDINVVDGKPGSVLIESKTKSSQKPFMVTSTVTGTKPLGEAMGDTDGLGHRGKDAERTVHQYFAKKGWRTISTPGNQHGDDFIFQKGSWQRRIEVKEINEVVAQPNGKVRHGRPWFRQSRVQELVDWERHHRGKAYIIIKINRADGSTAWKIASAQEMQTMLEGRGERVTPGFEEIEQLEDWDVIG